jgi:predicted ATPase/DNA-binding NarL/FixJ family response regulator
MVNQQAAEVSLPAQPTRLIGREAELDHASRLITDVNIRLLTLTGPPGTGKTRLAIALAENLQESFRDGVGFVELAEVKEALAVPAAIARELGLREGQADLVASLREQLRARRTLICLDNFEHLLEAGPLLSDLLTACAGLTFLITSRAALRLRWEQELPVLPLRLPATSEALSPPELSATPALALFLERARAVVPSFEITFENAQAVSDLCWHLDGLPLAIELTAPLVKVLTPAAILQRIKEGSDLPSTATRDAPGRHRSLEAAVDWSYELLNPPDQAVFRQVSLFAGGFSVPAADAVCRTSAAAGPSTLNALSQLIEHNLLYLESSEGDPRFRMLETVREYAIARLIQADEYEAAVAGHSDYFLALVQAAEPQLWAEGEAQWLSRLAREDGNLNAAMDRAGPEAALEFGGRLWRYWELSGRLTEGRSRLQAILSRLEAASDRPSPIYAAAHLGAGYLARDQGDLASAATRFQQSLTIAEATGDQKAIGSALRALAILAQAQGDASLAHERFTRALECFRSIDHTLGVGWILRNLGILAQAAGDTEDAAKLYSESLSLLEQIGDETGSARCLGSLGILARIQGRNSEAEDLLRRSLERVEHAGDQRGICFALCALAVLSLQEREHERAAASLQRIIHLAERIGEAECLSRALALAAVMLAQADEVADGLRLLAASSVNTYALEKDERSLVESFEKEARERLGETAYGAEWASGKSMSPSSAIEVALSACSPAKGRIPSVRHIARSPLLLSAREQEVLKQIAAGKTNREIAALLVLSEFTVMRHVSNILRKLNAPSRAAAVAIAGPAGLVPWQMPDGDG